MKALLKGITVAIITIILDQISKYYIFSLLQTLEYPVIPVTSFFNLVIVRNYGISFGMLNNLPQGQWILTCVALTIVIGLFFWLKAAQKNYVIVAIGLIIGGAIGNIVDRIRLGAVMDFLDFYIGSYHWPAFNVADSAVFIGVVLLCIDSYQEYRSKNESKN